MAAPTAPSLNLLNEAIATVSADRLRELVRELCATSETARKHLSYRLLIGATTELVDLTKDADKTPMEGGASASQKRKRTIYRYEMCEQCGEEYDVETSGRKDCRWHDGEDEPDYDGFFADHDEDCHGPIDSEWARKEYPDGFIWNCCDKIGANAKGCQKGRHVPADRNKAKRKL